MNQGELLSLWTGVTGIDTVPPESVSGMWFS